MRRRKRIIHEQIAISREGLGKSRIILFFLRMKACIFQKKKFTLLHRIDGFFSHLTHAILGEMDSMAKMLR